MRSKPPAKPTKAKPYAYKPQFGIVLICPTEKEQRLLYDALRVFGAIKIKVVSV